MKYKRLPQEALKLLACIAMLLDHIGATVFPSTTLRIIGRIAFPIYCFLLAQGVKHTRNPLNYLLRLAIGTVISELPFDYLFSGSFDWGYQNVMLTLFLGVAMLLLMRAVPKAFLRPLLILPFYILAELCQCDYGGNGILMIALFGLFESHLVQLLGLLLINYLFDSYTVSLFGLQIPIQMFAVLAIVPIALCSGKQLTRNRFIQWGFYLFYPAHLAVLLLVCRFIA